VTFLPKMTEHPEPGGVNLDHARVAAVVVVGVEPPAETCIERLRFAIYAANFCATYLAHLFAWKPSVITVASC
jgi:hypothetical protein